MQAQPDAPGPLTESRGSARGAVVAAGVLLVVMVVTAIPSVRLAIVGLAPVQALVEGIRLPAGLPRIGLPFGQHQVASYWLAETSGAVTLLVVFVARSLAARQPGRGRARVVGQVWLDTVLAVLVGCLVAAVAGSFLTADLPLPYLLMVAGTVLFALVIGAVLGVLTGLMAGLAHPRQPA